MVFSTPKTFLGKVSNSTRGQTSKSTPELQRTESSPQTNKGSTHLIQHTDEKQGQNVLKDTVCSRKQRSSGQQLSHYAAHGPNIHWNSNEDTRRTWFLLIFTDTNDSNYE